MKYIGIAKGGSVMWFEGDFGSHLIETIDESVDRFLGQASSNPRKINSNRPIHVSFIRGKIFAGIEVTDNTSTSRGEITMNREDLIFGMENGLLDGAAIELLPSMDKCFVEMLKGMG